MPDTRITRTSNGWIDKDNGATYRCRAEARVKRRALRLSSQTMAAGRAAFGLPPRNVVTRDSTTSQISSRSSLTSLQRRAYSRLANDLGMDSDEAYRIVQNHGYNAAVSYGHLRHGGATEVEAADVILKADPAFSVTYGNLRATGNSHDMALLLASV